MDSGAGAGKYFLGLLVFNSVSNARHGEQHPGYKELNEDLASAQPLNFKSTFPPRYRHTETKISEEIGANFSIEVVPLHFHILGSLTLAERGLES
ncbi:unnamed protein product [Allacma fusca]|uniref:Uncharacterized protein n=1 Tax=Allacma fusca TaxID=39272 RepID=A0A8J2KYB3_9HEXA|nr:unnamed protein product [Allacma fusca]